MTACMLECNVEQQRCRRGTTKGSVSLVAGQSERAAAIFFMIEACQRRVEHQKGLLSGACSKGLARHRLLHSCSLHQALPRTTFASGALSSL